MAQEVSVWQSEGASLAATSSSGVLTVPATTAITLTWPSVPKVRVLIVQVETTGAKLQVKLNGAGTADQTYDFLVTPSQPLFLSLLGITSVWLYNPGIADIVLNGAGKDGSVSAWPAV